MMPDNNRSRTEQGTPAARAPAEIRTEHDRWAEIRAEFERGHRVEQNRIRITDRDGFRVP